MFDAFSHDFASPFPRFRFESHFKTKFWIHHLYSLGCRGSGRGNVESTKKCGSSVPMNRLRKPGRSCCVLQWSMTALKGSTGSFGCRVA